MDEPLFAAIISPTLILVLVVTVGALVGVLVLRRRRNENINVESLPPSPAPSESTDLDAEVRQLVSQGNIIEAIKLVRERTGLGLKEAKDYVERMK